MKKSLWLPAAAVVILGAQTLISSMWRRDPYMPSPPPLVILPERLEDWSAAGESPLDAASLEMLGPDDSLSRQYRDPTEPREANLFVAYYKTQLRAKNAHDPKVCLPGSGWNPRDSRILSVQFPGAEKPLPINYYRIAKGDMEALVLYWFQTYRSVYALEQELRWARVIDATKANRTDMALVRIVLPVTGSGREAAERQALRFAQAAYPALVPYFPSKEKSDP